MAGPVVVHTGGAPALASLVKAGYLQGLLAGNALAVHDVERALYGTSLGVDLSSGRPVDQGHRNHMRAINRIAEAGSLAAAVQQGVLGSGIMYEVIRAGVPYALAGSIRDDGPLAETITDMIRAQEAYERILENASLVLMLGSMLHSIAVGNMLPSWVKAVCVDIAPPVITKLADRGSACPDPQMGAQLADALGLGAVAPVQHPMNAPSSSARGMLVAWIPGARAIRSPQTSAPGRFNRSIQGRMVTYGP